MLPAATTFILVLGRATELRVYFESNLNLPVQELGEVWPARLVKYTYCCVHHLSGPRENLLIKLDHRWQYKARLRSPSVVTRSSVH